jgi:hypothetical protein
MRITMVHQLAERYAGGAAHGQRGIGLLNETRHLEPRSPDRYVLVPDSLIATFSHDPLAVGVYAAIARLTVAARGAVPLAARDLAAWMASDRDADRAAIMRRIVKLEERGWVMVTRRTATKNSLLPTWGCDQSNVVRPWRFDRADSGRPIHLRGRRVPLSLFDDYLGRLDPQPGHGSALISRYFTQPLLDLTDIGIYTIGLRAEVASSPRLCHLGLQTAAGMLKPADGRSLLALANSGQLTTLEDDLVVAVLLSVHGHARLGIPTPTIVPRREVDDEHLCGSLHGSRDGSAGRSLDSSFGSAVLAHQNGQNATDGMPPSLIAWDVGIPHEQTNHDSAPDHALRHGGGAVAMADRFGCQTGVPQIPSSTPADPQSVIEDTLGQINSLLSDCVVQGHRALNRNRPIFAGEWHDLLALQEAHGTDQLLIWQARASRVRREYCYGITPAYYRTCAVRSECETYRPRSQFHGVITDDHAIPDGSTPAAMWLDPRCEPLLQAMGVRERQKLRGVPYELIASWHEALQHPGTAAYFTNPVGFAVAQMQRGNQPPPIVELDRWADQAQRTNDCYELWRYIEPSAAAVETTVDEHQLEARVRAIAPPNADLADLCHLASAIEAGATDAEALAQLRGKRVGGG